MSAEQLIGTSGVRLDAWEKVAGRCRYVADLQFPGAWFGGTIRSPLPRGRIRSIERDPAFDWSRVVLLTAADLPGPNAVAMIREDHPILADREVRFAAEPIALVAAPDPDLLAAALAAVRVEIEEQPPVLSIEEALAKRAIIWGDDNLLAEYLIEDGDLDRGFAKADLVIEETYRTGYQEHLYLEPNGVIALPRQGGGVEILGSLQCPYYIHTALVRALGLNEDDVIVKQVVTGGAFGGKEDFPSVLATHAALLALRTHQPVRMIYERTEDIRSTTKRHPSRTTHRTGVLRDGTIVAADIDFVLDGGAYTTLSPVVLSRGILHAGGVYRMPNVRMRGRAVATNTPPNGAFRGFGAPQSLFAIERQMDRIAGALGLDPLAVRRKNMLRDGDSLPFGQILPVDVAATLVTDRAVNLTGYERKYRANRAGGSSRGIGLAIGLHGGGFTGAGEERIQSIARVCFTVQGQLEIRVSNVEMGQGASTVLPMIAAQALGLPLDRVCHVQPDTSVVPDSGPTVASRTTMVVGRIIIDACQALSNELGNRIATERGAPRKDVRFDPDGVFCGNERLGDFAEVAGRHAPIVGDASYLPPPGAEWSEETYRGTAYKAYSWIANVVEVEVDPVTFEVRPTKVTAVVEIGKAIHPVLAIGQVEGGTLQAIGWGYLEEVKTDRGRYLNDRMTTYIIPTSLDAPAMEVEIAELPYERGPFGAKGLGELPMDVGAAALAAAVDQAASVFNREIPVTPERLSDLVRARSAGPRQEGS